jgi:hypothetical protein
MAKGHYRPLLNRRRQKLSAATKGDAVAQVSEKHENYTDQSIL